MHRIRMAGGWRLGCIGFGYAGFGSFLDLRCVRDVSRGGRFRYVCDIAHRATHSNALYALSVR